MLKVSQHSPSKLPEQLSYEQLKELGSTGDRLILAAAFAVAAERGLLPDGSRRAQLVGPQTDLELLEAVEDLTGYHIPRVAVCTEHNHVAPAQTFCDLYFERVEDCLWIGNRGGGKTTNSGFLHGAKSRWNVGYTTAISGAQEQQGYRAYAEFKRFIRHVGAEVLSTLLSKTYWANGAMNEVLGGTVRALNGPHPVFAQMDEAELTTPEPFQEFLNMAQSTDKYMRQQLLTSTRKRAHGIVQGIVNEVKEALKQGGEAPWRIDIFCVFETMAKVPNCRTAPENQGRPEAELCECHKVIKGEWGDEAPHRELIGHPRRFSDECEGKAFRSDGFVALGDVHRRFVQLSKSVWTAQQRCLTPDVEGLVHKWVKDKHRLPMWMPYAAFGPIYRGWDWGGQNPHAIVWIQKLTVPVGLAWAERKGQDGTTSYFLTPILSDDDEREIAYMLPEGAYIQFDEHYGNAQELGEFSTLGLRAVLREIQYRQMGYQMEIAQDFCDPAGYVAKREVKKAVGRLQQEIGTGHLSEEVQGLLSEMGIPEDSLDEHQIEIPNFKSIPAPRIESIRKHIELGEDDMLYYVPFMCPGTDDEYDVYHWLEPKPGKNVPEDAAKEDDHAMDAKRYLIWNVMRIDDKTAGVEPPGAEDKVPDTPVAQSPFAPPQTVPRRSDIPEPYEDDGPAATGANGEYRRARSATLPGRR